MLSQEVLAPFDRLTKETIFIRYKNLLHRIPVSDIVFLKSDYAYVEIHTISGKKFIHRGSACELLKRLPNSLFIQVHRSFYVSVDHILAINSEYLIAGEEELPLGRKYKQELLTHVKAYTIS